MWGNKKGRVNLGCAFWPRRLACAMHSLAIVITNFRYLFFFFFFSPFSDFDPLQGNTRVRNNTGKFSFPGELLGKLNYWKFLLSWKASILENLAFLDSILGNLAFPDSILGNLALMQSFFTGKLVYWEI